MGDYYSETQKVLNFFSWNEVHGCGIDDYTAKSRIFNMGD